MRAVHVLTHTHSSEGVEALMTALNKERGQPVVLNRAAPPQEVPEFDREGLRALKGLGSLM